jgi:Ser/Thr protein kinase RdoA (MazF antagonist)
VLGIEGPNIEVLDPVAAVDVVQRRTLTEGDADHTIGVDRPTRLATKTIDAVASSQLGEPRQISLGEALERADGVEVRHVLDPKRVGEAVEAAVAVGRGVGLRVEEPRVLRDLTNVVVHLAPAPVVARVPLTFARLRGREWVERELELVARLDERGLPVAAPTSRVAPGPYEHGGFLVTLWDYVEHDPDAALDPAAAGTGLRRIHEALAEVPSMGLAHYARLHELTALIDSLALDRAERSVLARGLSAAAEVADSVEAPLQPVHGDAHLGNVLRTAGGPVWSDFENACLGPRELDLAGLTIRGGEAGAEAATAYGEHDVELVRRLIPVHALFLAAWTCALAERAPAVRPHARERIGWVRTGFRL